MAWRLISILLLTISLLPCVFAKDIKLSVVLSQLQTIRPTEPRGDELYFSITEFSSKAQPRNYLIPEYPMHWLSTNLKDVRNVQLWDKIVQEGESTSIIFSLIEQELPPFYADELIGTVQLKVRNEKGILKREWVIPNKKDTQPVKQHANEFILDGSSGEYHLFLKLVERKAGPEDIKAQKAKNAQEKRNQRPFPDALPVL